MGINLAQREALPTSGAESKTGLSEFLSKSDEKSHREAILDQLVSNRPSSEKVADTRTQQVRAQPTQAPSTDEDLLRRLTEEKGSAESKPVSQPAQDKPEAVLPDRAAEDVLDELTGRSSPDKSRKPDNHQEENNA